MADGPSVGGVKQTSESQIAGELPSGAVHKGRHKPKHGAPHQGDSFGVGSARRAHPKDTGATGGAPKGLGEVHGTTHRPHTHNPAKSARERFFSAHPELAAHRPEGGALDRASFVAVRPGQSFVPTVREKYGKLSPETTRVLTRAVALFNERSGLPPDGVIAAPDFTDMLRGLTNLYELERDRQSGVLLLPHRDMSLIAEFGGDLDNVASTPTSGQAYEPRWDDTLRSVMLRAYKEQLVPHERSHKSVRRDESAELSPKKAKEKAERYMLVLALLNDLPGTRVAGQGPLYLPLPEVMDDLVNKLADTALTELKENDSPLLAAISGLGKGAQADARALLERRPEEGLPASEELGALEAALRELTASRQGRSHKKPEIVGFLPNETADAYLNRAHPLMSVEERTRALPRVKDLQKICGALEAKGLLSKDGRINIALNPGETFEQAAKRVVAGIGELDEPARALAVIVLVAVANHFGAAAKDGLPLALFMSTYVAATPPKQAPQAEDQEKAELRHSLRPRTPRAIVLPPPLQEEKDEGQAVTDTRRALRNELAANHLSFTGLSSTAIAELAIQARAMAERVRALERDTNEYTESLKIEAKVVIGRILKTEQIEQERASREIRHGQR